MISMCRVCRNNKERFRVPPRHQSDNYPCIDRIETDCHSCKKQLTESLESEGKFLEKLGITYSRKVVEKQMKQNGDLTFFKKITYLFNQNKKNIAKAKAILQITEREMKKDEIPAYCEWCEERKPTHMFIVSSETKRDYICEECSKEICPEYIGVI